MRRGWMRVFGFSASITVGAAYVGNVLATPASGFGSTSLAVGRFGVIDVPSHVLETRGPSDLYVQSNVWAPRGTTGWHTHPGQSLIIVTAGTVTAYEGDDPSCTPHVYTAGMGIVDPGGDHVHVLRNEDSIEARTIAVQLIPADATRRIDAEGPAACPF